MKDALRITCLLDGRVLLQKRDQIIEVQPSELAFVIDALQDAQGEAQEEQHELTPV